MIRVTRLLLGLALALCLCAHASAAARPPGKDATQEAGKITPWVVAQTADGAQAEFLVVLADQADLGAAQALSNRIEKGRYVYRALWQKAQDTQGPLLAWLKKNGVAHRPYYIVNAVWVSGSRDVVMALAARGDVARLEGNPAIHHDLGLAANRATWSLASPESVEPNIAFVRAPDVWALGFTGRGIVVGGQDTGYQWDHPALKAQYRGWDGATASHDYNWHDSIHVNGYGPNACGDGAPAPCDDYGHGTHTMGTAVGDDGQGNRIGMAPGARWIGCRNMDNGVGSPATYLECFEFFLAPYPVSGTPAEGDPDVAPDVTINSWSCPASEGCSAATLQAAVEAQRAAGIMTVVSAGNEGPACGSMMAPPAIYDAAYTVGALGTQSDMIATFSNRGPVTVDGSQRPKPDLSAPGELVRSSVRGGSYGAMSGTSMAGPHVAGAVALLWSAQPVLRNQLDLTEQALNASAIHLADAHCDAPGTTWPNNTFGYGRLDVKALVDATLLRTHLYLPLLVQ